MPKVITAAVAENRRLAEGVCALTLEAEGIAGASSPGQFVGVRCGEGLLLRRPISIAGDDGHRLTLVIEARGDGTAWLCGRRPGDTLDVLGPLGRGFDVSGRRLLLVGGGIGAPPLLYAAQKAAGSAVAVLGFGTSRRVILEDAFRSACDAVYVTTDDGTYGTHGYATTQAQALLSGGGYDAVLACGPRAMLKAVAQLCREHGVPCQVSLEERMGCGIGACLVCACKTNEGGTEHMRHVCKDGPVFDGREVCW